MKSSESRNGKQLKVIKVRLPLPRQRGGYHSSKKGKRGYNRYEEKKKYRETVKED